MTAGFDVLDSYGSSVVSMAKRLGKRKAVCSEPDGVAAASNDSVNTNDDRASTSASQCVEAVDANQDEKAHAKARDDKDIIFGMALKKVNPSLLYYTFCSSCIFES